MPSNARSAYADSLQRRGALSGSGSFRVRAAQLPGADPGVRELRDPQRPSSQLLPQALFYVPLSQTGAELLFEVFSQRYERGSTITMMHFCSGPMHFYCGVDIGVGVLLALCSALLGKPLKGRPCSHWRHHTRWFNRTDS
jgi:hypothetical protein